MTSCSPNSFDLVTIITTDENSCYPNSSLPGNRWYCSLTSLHVHHAYLNIGQNIQYEFFYSNPSRRRVGNFFFLSESVDSVTLAELFMLWWISLQEIFAAFSPPIFGRFLCHLFFFDFFSDIKSCQYRAVHS